MDNSIKAIFAILGVAILVFLGYTSLSSSGPSHLDLLNDDNLPVVQIHAYDYDESSQYLTYLGSGSGSIISDDYHILTNFHVISDYYYTDPVDIFEICATTEVDSEPFCNYTASLVDFDADKDMAILKMDHTDIYNKPLPKSLKKINMDFSEIPVGQEIFVLGYPGIGGSTMTFTNGSTSGYITNADGIWVKADAKIDSGNSGGAVVDQNLSLIGIPTFTITDTETIAYFKPLSDVADEIKAALEKDHQSKPSAREELRRVMKINLEAQTSDTYENDYPHYKIQLEDGWNFDYIDLTADNTVYIENDDDVYQVIVTSTFFPYDITVEDYVKWFQLYNGDAKYTDYVWESEAFVDDRPTYEYDFAYYPQIGHGYLFTAGNYAFDVYIMADQEASLAFDYDDYYQKVDEFSDMMKTFHTAEESYYIAPENYSQEATSYSISSIPGWHIATYPSDPDVVDLYHEDSVSVITIYNYWMDDEAWNSPQQDLENYVTDYYYNSDDLEIIENGFYSLAGQTAQRIVFEYQIGRNRYRELIYRVADWENERTLDIHFNALATDFALLLPQFDQIMETMEISQQHP